jgi:hypothetical protein
MRTRNLLLIFTLIAMLQLGSGCGQKCEFRVVAPGFFVDTFSFQVVVMVPTTGYSFDPATNVSLNSIVLPMTGTGPLYTATVDAGEFDLRDFGNVLTAEAVREDGGKTSKRWRLFAYRPPCKARAFQIRHSRSLLEGGPLVHNRIGDYRLENCGARFVIQDGGQRDMYSVGPFGGNIIDAELVSNPGADSFLEFQPLVNIENIFNAETVSVVNDGQNGLAAVIEACGPDDLLSFANPSSQLIDAGLGFPPQLDDNDLEVEGCTKYTLEPGSDTFVRVDTTVTNNDSVDLNLLVGDWMNGGGELEQWITPGKGLGAALFDVLGTLSYIGFGESAGIDYQYTTIPLPPPLDDKASNYLSVSGLTIILHNESILNALFGATPPFLVESGGSNTYTRYFGVGDGSGSNAIDMANQVKSVPNGTLSGCVTMNGTPVEGAKVSVGATAASGAIDTVVGSFRTWDGPCPNFAGTLPEGSYGAAAARSGAPYENGVGDPDPVVKPVIIASGVAETVDFDLPQKGHVCVDVDDEQGDPIPARVTVVGFDPSREPIVPGVSFLGFSGDPLGLFNDVADIVPFGVTKLAYADENGWVDFDLEPGDYQLYVSRGTEYSLFSVPIEVAAGPCSDTVQAVMARVLDTTGFVSSDFHVHGIRSPDSRISDANRVLQFAGEGIEAPIMTDHHVHTDLNPEIAAQGMASWMSAIIGEELTTFDYGHFNAYPLTIDPTRPSGGSTDWGMVAPAGEAFPSYYNYVSTPAEIEALATLGPQSTPDTMVQINHIDSHFDPMRIDSSLVPPVAALDATQRANRRLPPGSDNLFHHFPALELWNGYNRNHQQNEFLNQRIGIWFNLLNQGLLTTAIADTDSHTFENMRTAGARTWTASPTDAPVEIAAADVAQAAGNGRAVGGQGVYVQTRIIASGGNADLTLDGSTTVADDDGNVELEIRIQSPLWVQWDNVKVYVNSMPVATKQNTTPPAVDVLFDPGAPMLELDEGDCDASSTGDGDFDIDDAPPGVARLEETLNLPLALVEDSWVVVVVSGTDGYCEPMFPVYAADLDDEFNITLADLLDGNLDEGGVMALGFTNALFVDVGGDGWKGPLEP